MSGNDQYCDLAKADIVEWQDNNFITFQSKADLRILEGLLLFSSHIWIAVNDNLHIRASCCHLSTGKLV